MPLLPSRHNLSNMRQTLKLKDELNTTLHTQCRRWLDRILLQTNFPTVSSWTLRSMKTSWWAGLLMQNQTAISTGILQWWFETKVTKRTNGEQNRLDKMERVSEGLKRKPSEREMCTIIILSRDTLPSHRETSTLLQTLGSIPTTVLWSTVVQQLLIYPSNKWPQSTMANNLTRSNLFRNATPVLTIESWRVVHWLVIMLSLQMWAGISTGK